MRHLLTICLFTPILFVLCWKDWRTRTLPNVLTFGMGVLAIVWRLCADGTGGVADGLFGGLAAGLFLLVPYLMKAAGGGDVKMIAAVGILTGFRLCVAQLLFVAVAGLLLAGYMLVTRTVSAVRVRHVFRCVFDWRYDRAKGREGLPPRQDETTRVPFGVAIAAGTLATLAYAWYLETAP